jgi:rare lipoprotein A
MGFEYCRQRCASNRQSRADTIAASNAVIRFMFRSFSSEAGRVTWLLILCPIFSCMFATAARAEDKPFEVGIASVYWEDALDARGLRFDKDGPTVAHKSLPFGTIVQVRVLGTKQRCWATVTDRGPFVEGRIVDLTLGSAHRMGIGAGLARVRLDIVADGRRQPLYPMFVREAAETLERINGYRRMREAESTKLWAP